MDLWEEWFLLKHSSNKVFSGFSFHNSCNKHSNIIFRLVFLAKTLGDQQFFCGDKVVFHIIVILIVIVGSKKLFVIGMNDHENFPCGKQYNYSCPQSCPYSCPYIHILSKVSYCDFAVYHQLDLCRLLEPNVSLGGRWYYYGNRRWSYLSNLSKCCVTLWWGLSENWGNTLVCGSDALYYSGTCLLRKELLTW